MSPRRWPADEVEARPEPVETLPLFADWPEAPPAEAENHVLPIDGTIEASYRHWRGTEHGQRVYAAFCAEALGEIARGATRLSAKGSWERMRARLRVPLNNSFTALVARDAEADHPTLRGMFEKRQRKAS